MAWSCTSRRSSRPCTPSLTQVHDRYTEQFHAVVETTGSNAQLESPDYDPYLMVAVVIAAVAAGAMMVARRR